MLPGDGRGPPPGRGAPGRGCGRGMGRSTGCCEENGLLPTRGARGAGFGAPEAGPGRGPGVAGRGPGVASGAGAAGSLGATAAGSLGAAGACGAAGLGAAGRAGATGAASAAGACGSTAGAAGAAGFAGAGLAGAPGLGAAGAAALPCGRGWSSGFLPPALLPKDSRNRRATGASTVEDADLTNSPCSLSLPKSSLLVTPSSFANSCTRALPAATTSPRLEATAVVGAAPRV